MHKSAVIKSKYWVCAESINSNLSVWKIFFFQKHSLLIMFLFFNQKNKLNSLCDIVVDGTLIV